ncbi:MAG: DUF2520 domain-containing protein [Acidobacteriota bacterium]|nr:DUF2520 domain-containing protein [Acidobacteriota bacterium]
MAYIVYAKVKNRRKRLQKPTISFIGAGRMGTALARALSSKGYTVLAMVARKEAHARRAAELAGAHGALAVSHERLRKIPESDILFITTPDDAIGPVAAQLAAHFGKRLTEAGGREKRARTALHASGALSSEALGPLKEAGFATGSLHPLLSVSDAAQGAERLASAFFCVEGDERARRVARLLVRDIGAKSFSIDARDKALYHAAAVMASGHVTALFDMAAEMLERCGLEPKRARGVLLPLLRSALENLCASDPAHALTGTFARADTSTVRRHLAALGTEGTADALAGYRLLGLRSLQLAREAGASEEALEEIERLLRIKN